jgi:hypothetical protein
MQPTHNSKAPGYNPWKLYKVMSWFLKPLLSKRNLCRYAAFRLALTVLNVLVIIIAVCFLVVFIMLDVAPGMVAKLRKTWADRKNQKERTEKKKKLALEKKERKAKGLKDEDKQLSIYAQFKLFSFIKRCLVSAQAARFFNPRATDAVGGCTSLIQLTHSVKRLVRPFLNLFLTFS